MPSDPPPAPSTPLLTPTIRILQHPLAPDPAEATPQGGQHPLGTPAAGQQVPAHPPNPDSAHFRATRPPGPRTHEQPSLRRGPARVSALDRTMVGLGMGNHTIRVTGSFTTQAVATLLDVATSRRFVTEVLRLLQGPPIATIAQDIASALEAYGHVPGPGERGVFAAAYASLAGATVRTLPGEGGARIDVVSYAQAIEPSDIHALVWRHYATRELKLVDLGRWG